MQQNLPFIPTIAANIPPGLPVIQPLTPTTGQTIFPTMVGNTRTTPRIVTIPTAAARPPIATIPVPNFAAASPLQMPTIRPTQGTQLPPLNFPTMPIITGDSDEEDYSYSDESDWDDIDSDEDENITPFDSPVNVPFQPIVPITPLPMGNKVPLLTQLQTPGIVPTIPRTPVVAITQPTAPILPGIGTMPFVRPNTPAAQGLGFNIAQPVRTPTIPVIQPGTQLTITRPTIGRPVTP